MLDIRKEYENLKKRLNRYKTKSLGFEYGCLTGKVANINLIKIKDDRCWKRYSEAIQIVGIAGLSNEEHTLMILTEDNVKGKDYKYNWKYHIFEKFTQDFSSYEIYED